MTNIVTELAPVAASIVLRRYGMASDIEDRIAASYLSLMEGVQRYDGTQLQQQQNPAHQARYLLSVVAGDMRKMATRAGTQQKISVPFTDYSINTLEQIPYTPAERDILNHHTLRVKDGRLMTGMEIINAIMATDAGTTAVAKHLGLYDPETKKMAAKDHVRFGLTMEMMGLVTELATQPAKAPVTKKYTNGYSIGHTITTTHTKNGELVKTTVLGPSSSVVNGEIVKVHLGDEAILEAATADNWDAEQEEIVHHDIYDVVETPSDMLNQDLWSWPEEYMGNGAWRELVEIWNLGDAVETVLWLAHEDQNDDSRPSIVLQKLARLAAGYQVNPNKPQAIHETVWLWDEELQATRKEVRTMDGDWSIHSGWTDETCTLVAAALARRMLDRGVEILSHVQGRDPLREIKEQLCAFMGVDTTEAYDYTPPHEGTLLNQAEEWCSEICELTSNQTRNALKALVLFGASPYEANREHKGDGWLPE